MRLAFLGTPAVSVPSLAAQVQAGHDIAGVYPQPPAPKGRGQALQPSAVHAYAELAGLDVRTPKSLRDPAEIEAFRALELEVAVVVAYGQILVGDVLRAPRLGCFNLHASLLPRWRGAAPIQRAIMAGDAETGVQVMAMSEGLDEGAVLLSRTTEITASDTAGSLSERLAEIGAVALPEALNLLSGGTVLLTAQASEGVTYAKKIKPREARIDWSRPAAELDRHIRGLSPFPGAWFEVDRPKGAVRVKALLSRLEPRRNGADGGDPPGAVLDDALLVACGDGALRLLQLQREGRGPQTAGDFLRGLELPPTTRLL